MLRNFSYLLLVSRVNSKALAIHINYNNMICNVFDIICHLGTQEPELQCSVKHNIQVTGEF